MIKYRKKLFGYKHTCNKPPEVLEAFPQLAGDFPSSWEVPNILVFNKWRAWEGCFSIVLEFRKYRVVTNGGVLKWGDFWDYGIP